MAYQPKSYKKFVATAATATLVATAVVPAAFANEVETAAFTDVAKQYEAAVNFVVANNIAKGLNETQFGVSEQIKRGDAAIMIANAAGLNNEEAPQSGFSDVPTRGVLAINSLKAAGVVNGKTATNFGFNDSITRGEAAIMLANAFDLDGSAENVKFTDVNSRYIEAVAALVENEVTNGISATQFGTANNIKRGDFARFIYALEEYIVPVGAPAVTTVSAKNGEVSATFGVAPETAPAAADFTVTRSINGGAAVTVTPTDFEYNEASKSVTFDVPEVAQTNAAQTVTYSVKYKDTAAKTGSFTIAATPASAVHSIAGDATTDTMTVIFTQPVSNAVATALSNYTYDKDSTTNGDATYNPTSVSVNTDAVGPFAAGQVVTLKFANGALETTDVSPALRVNGFSATGETFTVSSSDKPTVFAGITAARDTTLATIVPGTVEFSAGGTPETSVSAGTSVTLTLDATDADTSVAAVQYRLVRPDGTRTSFSTLAIADTKTDEEVETFTGSINTAGFAPGQYTVEYRTVNSAGVATPSNAITTVAGSTLYVTGQDLAAPYFIGETLDNTELNADDTPARSLTVTSVGVRDLDANVANVEYRVESYNALSNVYTTVTGWTNAPANDGAFDESAELFSFNTGSLAPGATYRVQVRATDSKGNVSQPSSLLVAGFENFNIAPASEVAPVFNDVNVGDEVTVKTGLESANPGTVERPASSRDLTVIGSASGGAGAATETVTGVQYSVLKDTDLNGSYETTVQEFTSTGVTANDGSFNGEDEAFTIETTVPSDGNYRVIARVTNSAGQTTTTTLGESLNVFVDATAPVATITPNTTTVAANDFIVTFNEAVEAADVAVDGRDAEGNISVRNISQSALDEDNYTLRAANGQIISYASSAAANPATANSFIVTFDSTPTPVAGTTVNVVGVEDITSPGNVVAPTAYTIR